ncbi:hypothetical protein QQZ08_011685 [Neonectria magnoliae]|uniref:Uncharacterized protein n=1 Tax=Neonectria magnoliae TaxID=2732573 RepID=A0ABR1H8D1_9HYPO
MFDPENREATPNFKADYVRWEMHLTEPTNSKLPDPEVILDMPSEVVRIDERYLTRPTTYVLSEERVEEVQEL